MSPDLGRNVNGREGGRPLAKMGAGRARVVAAHRSHLDSFGDPRKPGLHNPLRSLGEACVSVDLKSFPG